MTSTQIRRKIAESKDSAKKIIADAKADGREIDALTPEETAQLQTIHADGSQLETDLQAAEQRENVVAWTQADLPPTRNQNAPHPTLPNTAIGTGIPATVKRHKTPKGFETPEAAYRAGRFFAATLCQHPGSIKWCNEHGVPIGATLYENVNTGAGYLVADEIETAITILREEYGLARRLCDVTPMASETKLFAILSSGLTAYAVGEGSAGTATQQVYRQGQLIARTWQTQTQYSMELSDDAYVSIAGEIARDIAYAFANAEDDALFKGDGTSTYHNIVGVKTKINNGDYTASVYEAISGNTAFSTLDMADFEAMVGKLPIFPGIMPSWIISKPGWAASMARLLHAAGGATISETAGTTPVSFLGFPVVWAPGSLMNTTLTAQTSTTSLVLLADLKMAAKFGARAGITIASDPYSAMSQRLTTIYGVERFDINVHSLGSTSAAGPVISLSTPAS